MQRRATSKKRAAEAEKEVEIDMENKEATPVDVESSLPPVLSKQPAQPEEQPEMPTQTGEVNQENLDKLDERMELLREEPVSYTHLDVYKRQYMYF